MIEGARVKADDVCCALDLSFSHGLLVSGLRSPSGGSVFGGYAVRPARSNHANCGFGLVVS